MTEQAKHRRHYSYRPPKHLAEKFERLVALSGLSVNAFLTEGWHGRNRIRPAEIKLLARLLGMGQRITDKLKPFNIAAARDSEIKALLTEIRDVLIEIRSALFTLMGRKP